MKTRLKPEDVAGLIASYEIIQPTYSTLTLCVMELTNGCTVVGKSNVIDPTNYDAELGKQAAITDATKQIWGLEGFACKRDMFQRPIIAARAAHEINRLHCIAAGDTSLVPWDASPDWQKDSVLAGVMAIINNPDTTPAECHEGWMTHKLADGWKCGPTKDPEAKTHPCLVPYEMLPEHQRRKDDLFATIVKAVLAD